MNVSAWLEEQKISAGAYDAGRLLNGFLAEMQRGLEGGSGSLAMIPAYIGVGARIAADKPVAVIDAGGTNLRIGIARFDAAGTLQLSGFTKQAMPGRDRQIGAAEFYKVLVDALEPLQDQFETIGFCFSYPAEITPDLDGRLLHWTKEIKIPEMIGQRVGAGLIAALEARGIRGRQVAVLNDTVAALLAGLAQGQLFNASSYVGFILGTGTNTAYVEHNEKIGKIDSFLDLGTQVINVESGGFNGFERTAFDLALDARSENPGGHVFEKTISGVYMGPLTLELLKALASEGAFSESGAAALRALESLSTVHVDNFAAGRDLDTGILETEVFSDADRDVIRTVFNAVVDRASLLTAVNILAAVVQSGAGEDPDRPVCVNIDGSTYYKVFLMADKVQSYLQPLLAARGLHIRCIHVDEAPVAGAAIAGLTAFH